MNRGYDGAPIPAASTGEPAPPATAELRARIARYELPGRRWYIAVCEGCAWVGMSWKDKGWAKDARDRHNRERHPR